MTKAIERVETKGNLAVVPAHLQQFVGTGDAEQEIGRDDVLIPRLAVAQDGMSPQLKKSNELYIPELEAGDLFNTVTNEVYGPSVTVIPLFFYKNYIEFAPGMGGVLGQYKNETDLPQGGLDWCKDDEGKPTPPRITEFKNRMALIMKEGRYQPIVISFKKGEVKNSDQWNSLIKFARMADGLPAFAHTYTITSKLKSKGAQTWYVKTVTPDGFTPEAIFAQAKQYFDQLHQGGYTVDTTGIETESKDDGDDTSFDQAGG